MRTIFTLTLLCLSIFITAQNKSYLNSYNEVHSLKVQGAHLWVGTTKGLVLRNKYTGEICGIFNASNSPVPTNHVYDLEIGPDGALWIATHENVVRFDGEEFTVEYEGLSTQVAFDDAGALMVATKIYLGICTNGFGLLSSDLASGYVSDVVSNSAGQNYFLNEVVSCAGSGWGNYCYPTYSSLQSLSMQGTLTIDVNSGGNFSYPHIDIDNSGNLYFVIDNEKELRIYDSQTQEIEYFSLDSIADTHGFNPVQDSSFDPEGNFWMVNRDGVIKFDGTHFIPQNAGLPYRNPSAIEIDSEGNMFLGFLYGGIRTYDGSEWGNVWLDGFLSNSVTNVSSNSTGITSFGSNRGVSILNNGVIASFHPENSIITGGETYVDETGNIFVHPVYNKDTLFFYDGVDWSVLDFNNSNLTFYDFEFVHSDTAGNVWIKNVSESNDTLKAAKFNNGVWTNYTTLDSLNNNIPGNDNLWQIIGTSAFFIKNNDTMEYPIPLNPNNGECLENSIINEEGIGLAAVLNRSCGGLGFHWYDLFYFDGNTWTLLGDSNGEYEVPQMGFRGADIYLIETPEYYQCGPAKIRIVKPDFNMVTIILPTPNLPDNISNYFQVFENFIEVVEGEGNQLWLNNNIYFASECNSLGNQYTINRTQIFTLNADNLITPIEEAHCQSFEDLVANIYKDRNGIIWNIGKKSTYRTGEFPPILETFACGINCAANSISCVTSGGVGPYQYTTSNGDTSPLAWDHELGTFSITVTDAILQSNTNTYDIEETNGIDLQLTIQANQGQPFIASTVQGGTPPFQFNWSDGTTDSLLTAPLPGIYQLTVTDANGCEMVSTIEYEETTATNSLVASSHSIFPNPVTTNLLIQSSGCDEFKLFNAVGKYLLTTAILAGQDSSQIDFRGFPPGVYFIQGLKEGQKIWMEKVVKVM